MAGARDPELNYTRSTRSHIRDDGVPKVSYETVEEAREAAALTLFHSGTPQDVYLCEQGPTHWHMGRKLRQQEVK